MVFRRFLNVAARGVACAFVLAALVCVGALGASRFPQIEGQRTFYLYSASSQATQKTRLALSDLGRVKGESVRVCGGDAQTLLQTLRVEVLCIEEAAGVRSYYGYAKSCGEGLWIGEHYVNVQIAEGESGCVVGSPIIFGGF